MSGQGKADAAAWWRRYQPGQSLSFEFATRCLSNTRVTTCERRYPPPVDGSVRLTCPATPGHDKQLGLRLAGATVLPFLIPTMK